MHTISNAQLSAATIELHAKTYPRGCAATWKGCCEDCCARLGNPNEPQVFRIPEPNLDRLREKFAKLSKKAVKLGFAPILLADQGTEDVAVTERVWNAAGTEMVDQPTGEVRRYYLFTIQGERPHLAGWEFVATLQHMTVEGEGSQNILRTSPTYNGGDLPIRFRTAVSTTCDHCHTSRYRKETFVVRSEAGEFKQIGRQCIADFLGGVSVDRIASFLEYLRGAADTCALEEGEGGWGAQDRRFSTTVFLAHVAAAIRVIGWVSRRKAEAMETEGTASVALQVMFARGKTRDQLDPKLFPVAEDFQRAEDAVSWARDYLTPELRAASDFNFNMWVALSQSAIDYSLTGMVGYTVAMYNKAKDIEMLEAKFANTSNSKHIGQVKDRVLLKVLLTREAGAFDSMFGTTYLHKFATPDGDVVTAYINQRLDVKPGFETYIKGTVTDHKVYKDKNETKLNRVVELTAAEYEAELEKVNKKTARAAKKAAKAAQ